METSQYGSYNGRDDMKQDSVAEKIWRYKMNQKNKKEAFWFSLGSGILAMSLYFFLWQFPFYKYVPVIVSPYVYWSVLGTMVLVSGLFVMSLICYVYYQWFSPVLYITPHQKKLFNINDGSRDVVVMSEQQMLAQQQREQLNRAAHSSPSSSPQQLMNRSYDTSLQHVTSLNLSYSPSPSRYSYPPNYSSLPYSPTNSPFSLSGGGSSWLNSSSPTSPLSPSYDTSQSFLMTGSPLNVSGGSGGRGYSNDRAGMFSSSTPSGPLSSSDDLHRRHQANSRSPVQKSPKRVDSVLCGTEELRDFLDKDRSRREEDERFYAALNNSRLDHSNGSAMLGYNPLSRWSAGLGLIKDWFGPSLSRFRYQPASITPNQYGSSTDGNIGGSGSAANSPAGSGNTAAADLINSSFTSADIWSQFGVGQSEVDRWRQNLREWISETILSRVVSEIENCNKTLVSISSDDIQIGKVSIGTLKVIQQSKSQYVPTLERLLSFLDVTAYQEYLVQRIKDLSSTGCMSSYRWSSGGDYKGKPWEENLPTDADLVMHMLCTYLDTRLPIHPRCIDGKTFTSQNFFKTPDKPTVSGDKKDLLCIYETRIHPPHFVVIIADHCYNIEPGRNNLFDAVLVFLYHLKTKENGMLRRLSLGMTGINILWIFDQ